MNVNLTVQYLYLHTRAIYRSNLTALSAGTAYHWMMPVFVRIAMSRYMQTLRCTFCFSLGSRLGHSRNEYKCFYLGSISCQEHVDDERTTSKSEIGEPCLEGEQPLAKMYYAACNTDHRSSNSDDESPGGDQTKGYSLVWRKQPSSHVLMTSNFDRHNTPVPSLQHYAM